LLLCKCQFLPSKYLLRFLWVKRWRLPKKTFFLQFYLEMYYKITGVFTNRYIAQYCQNICECLPKRKEETKMGKVQIVAIACVMLAYPGQAAFGGGFGWTPSNSMYFTVEQYNEEPVACKYWFYMTPRDHQPIYHLYGFEGFSSEDVFISFSPDEEIHELVLMEPTFTYIAGGTLWHAYLATVYIKYATMPPSPGGTLPIGVRSYPPGSDKPEYNYSFKLDWGWHGHLTRTQYIHVNPLPNQAPVAVALANGQESITVEQEKHEGTLVTLDGSGSTDIDSTPGTNDDIVSFDWYKGNVLIGNGETIEHMFQLGSYVVTLVVTDSKGETDNDDVAITVIDTTPPTINSISADPSTLWPPNHEMVEVTVTIDAYDICDESPVSRIINVTCNEPINGPSDGNTEPDWAIMGDLTVTLRAERMGAGTGRVYTIYVESADASGNAILATTEVTVPHDKS
jgi:hypothetical protein